MRRRGAGGRRSADSTGSTGSAQNMAVVAEGAVWRAGGDRCGQRSRATGWRAEGSGARDEGERGAGAVAAGVRAATVTCTRDKGSEAPARARLARPREACKLRGSSMQAVGFS